MTKSLFFALGLAAALTSAALLNAGPAAAQPSPAAAPGGAMAAPAMDCTKAGSMMSQAAKMGQAQPAMTGDVDRDFRAMTMSHDKATMMMAQVEVSCGKDPATKAAAGKVLQDANDRLQMFRNQGQS